jgi:DNA-directed RNA polymerase subunit RPC12/RpoP
MADSQSVQVACANCGHKFAKAVSGLKRKPEFPCPKCGASVNARKFVIAFEKLEKARDDLARNIRKRFGK